MSNVSETFKRSVFGAQTDEVFICLITLDHATFDEPIRISSDPYEILPEKGSRGVVSRGAEYVYLPFSVNLPSSDDTGVSRATLAVDNINRDIVAAVRNADSSLSVAMEVVLSSDMDNPEVSFRNFRLERVKYDAVSVTGDITVEYFDAEPFPSRRFTPSDFPGLF